MHYNFCRVHQTLRVTPAMAAGLSDHVWELSELIALMPKPVARPWGSVKRRLRATRYDPNVLKRYLPLHLTAIATMTFCGGQAVSPGDAGVRGDAESFKRRVVGGIERLVERWCVARGRDARL